MHDLNPEIIKALGVAAALALAIVAQSLSPHARLQGSWRVNGALWLVGVVVVGLLCGGCGMAAARWADAGGVGIIRALHAPAWTAIPVTILTLDLVSYAWHRANHAVPFLWRFHRVHHSDRAFTVSTALRFHPGELLLSLPLRLTAVVALGAPVAAVLAFEVVFAAANLIEHGDIDLPRRAETAIGRWFITPGLHRLHHSRTWADLNTNFGTIFAVWDRLFRSYRPSSSDLAIEIGLPDSSEVSTLGDALLLPLHTHVVVADG